MEAKAYLNYVRISPRKISIVLDLIRGKDVTLAEAILKATPITIWMYQDFTLQLAA